MTEASTIPGSLFLKRSALEKTQTRSIQLGVEKLSVPWRLLPIFVCLLIAADRARRFQRDGNKQHDSGASKPWKSRIYALAEISVALTLYCLAGPGLILLNKFIYTRMAFSFPMFVSNLGNIFLVLATRGGAQMGLWSPKTQELPWRTFLSNVVPLSVTSCLSIVVGNVVYLYISLPLIQIMKSATLVLVMLFGFALGVERFRWGLVAAIITIVLGISLALQSGYDPIAEGSGLFFKGVFFMMFGNVMEALRAVILQVSVDKLEFADSLYWCSPTMAIVGLVMTGTMEMRHFTLGHFTPHVVICLVGSAVLGGCVSFSTFWVTKLIGGLSLKVLVSARNIGLVLYSVVVLGEPCSPMEYVGYSVALVGLELYDRVRQTVAQPAGNATVERRTVSPSHQKVAVSAGFVEIEMQKEA